MGNSIPVTAEPVIHIARKNEINITANINLQINYKYTILVEYDNCLLTNRLPFWMDTDEKEKP